MPNRLVFHACATGLETLLRLVPESPSCGHGRADQAPAKSGHRTGLACPASNRLGSRSVLRAKWLELLASFKERVISIATRSDLTTSWRILGSLAPIRQIRSRNRASHERVPFPRPEQPVRVRPRTALVRDPGSSQPGSLIYAQPFGRNALDDRQTRFKLGRSGSRSLHRLPALIRDERDWPRATHTKDRAAPTKSPIRPRHRPPTGR